MASLTDDAITRAAARWFARMSNAPADHPERSRFESWLVASPRHAEEYARFNQLWADFDTASRLERLTVALESQRDAEKARRARQRRAVLGGAGALGLLAWIGHGVWSRLDETPSVSMARSTGRRQMMEQALPDGSRLVLAPESDLSVRYFQRRREIDLVRGEAVFDVMRDVARPFTVSCLLAKVTVLGTRFAVQRLPDDRVRVSVLEGRVRLDAAEATRTLELAAGEVAELSAQGALQRVNRRADDAQAWRQGRLVFDADRLAEVVQRLSRHSAKPLELSAAAADVAQRRITAVVQLNDVDAFVRQLPHLAPVQLQDTGGRLVVTPRSR
jgi:transmembrane sensor